MTTLRRFLHRPRLSEVMTLILAAIVVVLILMPHTQSERPALALAIVLILGFAALPFAISAADARHK